MLTVLNIQMAIYPEGLWGFYPHKEFLKKKAHQEVVGRTGIGVTTDDVWFARQ